MANHRRLSEYEIDSMRTPEERARLAREAARDAALDAAESAARQAKYEAARAAEEARRGPAQPIPARITDAVDFAGAALHGSEEGDDYAFTEKEVSYTEYPGDDIYRSVTRYESGGRTVEAMLEGGLCSQRIRILEAKWI